MLGELVLLFKRNVLFPEENHASLLTSINIIVVLNAVDQPRLPITQVHPFGCL